MPVLEWGVAFDVQSPYSTLPINQDLGPTFGGDWSGRQFRLVPAKCRANRGIRAEVDPIPQGDGQINHERYSEGYWMQLGLALWQSYPADGGDGSIACDEALCEMGDLLGGVFWSLLRPPSDGGRVFWTPSCGGDRRLLDAVVLSSFSDPEEGDEGVTIITVVVDSPFPYAINFTQDTTVVTGTETIPNDGNVEFWPVIKVFAGGSDLTAFTIEADTGLLISWDAAFSGFAIPAGDYVEIDTFRGTMHLNGDEDDMTAGLVPTTSDFFPIAPGGTEVQAIGAAGFDNATFLTNDAWA